LKLEMKIMDDLTAMRERDRTARLEKLYGHHTTVAAREDAAGPKTSPQSAMATRHADEVGEQQARHHRESRELYQRHAEARGKRLQTSHALDGNLDRDQARERDELHEKHAHQRSAMQRRHLVERDSLRRKAR
jgi:hypothetical protein